MSDLLIFLLFSILIISLFVERHFYTRQVLREKEKLLDEMSRLVKAVISKNANDYVMTASIDKVATEEKQPLSPDLVDPDTLTDDEFDQSLGIKRTPPK